MIFSYEKDPCHTQRWGWETSKSSCHCLLTALPFLLKFECKPPGGDPWWLPAAALHLPPHRLLAAVYSSWSKGNSWAERKKPSVFERRQGCEGERARMKETALCSPGLVPWTDNWWVDPRFGKGVKVEATCASQPWGWTVAGNRGRISIPDSCRCIYKHEHVCEIEWGRKKPLNPLQISQLSPLPNAAISASCPWISRSQKDARGFKSYPAHSSLSGHLFPAQIFCFRIIVSGFIFYGFSVWMYLSVLCVAFSWVFLFSCLFILSKSSSIFLIWSHCISPPSSSSPCYYYYFRCLLVFWWERERKGMNLSGWGK